MMKHLSQKQAAAILAELPYDRWLSVGRMTPPRGIHRTKISGIRELHWFLEPSSRSLPAVRLDLLMEWLERSVGDVHLAAGVRRIDAQEASYVEKCQQLHALLGDRIRELETVAQGRKRYA